MPTRLAAPQCTFGHPAHVLRRGVHRETIDRSRPVFGRSRRPNPWLKSRMSTRRAHRTAPSAPSTRTGSYEASRRIVGKLKATWIGEPTWDGRPGLRPVGTPLYDTYCMINFQRTLRITIQAMARVVRRARRSGSQRDPTYYLLLKSNSRALAADPQSLGILRNNRFGGARYPTGQQSWAAGRTF
jgi:hypothetical protein